MSTELSQPAQLRCSIVRVTPGVSEPNYEYVVTDENYIVVATGVSSSEAWVRNDAGGYHTKRNFDAKFPQGWHVNFDF
jgi:hypothetical protein